MADGVSPTMTQRDTTPRYGAPRYGKQRRRPSPRAQRWGIIGALVLAVVFAAWVTWDMAYGELEHNDVGYTIHSETRAGVDYEVTKDFDATAQCMLHALDESYAIVGAQIVTIGPHEGSTSADRSQYLRSELRTEHLAVTAVVDSCWLVE